MTYMDEDRFWKIIEQSKRVLPDKGMVSDRSLQCQELATILGQLSPEDVAAFDGRFYMTYVKAENRDLWAAYIALTQLSGEDNLDAFIKSAISLGRRLFCQIICSPDRTLARHHQWIRDIDCLEFGAVAEQVYERLTGSQIPRFKINHAYVGKPLEPGDYEDLRLRAPRLWKLYGHLITEAW